MILGSVQEHSTLAPQQSNDKSDAQSLSGQRIHLASVCMVIAGILLSAPSALSQNASTPDVPVQHSTCASDPQGLMCNSSQRGVSSAATHASRAINATTMVPALSDAQMERLSDVLLGLLYFVLPIGFGLTLFLHDRYQAYRASLLEAQIKLLEKLWEQTPQA